MLTTNPERSESAWTSQSGTIKRPSDDGFATMFAELLVERDLIDASVAARGRRAADASGERFDHVLVKLGMISETDLANAYAAHCRLPLASADDVPPRPVLDERLRTEFLRTNRILPMRRDARGLDVAVVDPFLDDVIDALSYMLDVPVTRAIMAPADFEEAFAVLYGERDDPAPTPSHSSAFVAGNANDFDVERLRDIANEAPIIRLVSQIIAKAVERRVSDIHIEPGRDAIAIRYRIDGVLQTDQTLDSGMRAALTTRVKIMATLDIAERRLPQDGRIKTVVRGVEIDIRVSSLPTIFGESLVMRLLDRTRVELDLSRIGLDQSIQNGLKRQMSAPNGIILVTGPTGSGKTTTLYAALNHLNRPASKLFTVEDPIEYQLQGITQVQVQPQIGLDFPRALRSMLRQDPDVIMIGEIRDLETARIAIQAALTGHLVFSTLHTNDAVAAVTRMVDIGIEPYLLASTVVGVMAQRLVRRLCPFCSIAAKDEGAVLKEMDRVGLACGQIATGSIRLAVGCESCRGTGYNGRTVLAELLTVDDDFRAAVVKHADQRTLAAAAAEKGHRTLYVDGLAKVAAGETSMDEVLRVTRAA